MKDFFLKKSFIDGRESWEVEVDHLSEGKQVYPMCGTSFIRCVTLLTDVSSALSLRVSLPNNKKRNLLHTGRLLERDESTMGRLLERRIYQGGQACLFDKELKFPYQSAAAVDMSPYDTRAD